MTCDLSGATYSDHMEQGRPSAQATTGLLIEEHHQGHRNVSLGSDETARRANISIICEWDSETGVGSSPSLDNAPLPPGGAPSVQPPEASMAQ